MVGRLTHLKNHSLRSEEDLRQTFAFTDDIGTIEILLA
jgi:hypothetical protein